MWEFGDLGTWGIMISLSPYLPIPLSPYFLLPTKVNFAHPLKSHIISINTHRLLQLIISQKTSPPNSELSTSIGDAKYNSLTIST